MKFPQEALDLSDAIFNPHNKDGLEIAGNLILNSVGENPFREGLMKTPARFSKAMKELCSGYALTPADAVGEGVFASEGGLVSVKDVEYFSLCEHHMLPFWGKASVAYYPSDKIVGLSKIPRLVQVFSKRLQVQERLTGQIAKGLQEVVQPRAIVVRVTGSHMCMMMRGVKSTGSVTVTEFSIGTENLTPQELERLWKSIE